MSDLGLIRSTVAFDETLQTVFFCLEQSFGFSVRLGWFVPAGNFQESVRMRIVPTIFHGIADYVVGAIVCALPFYYGWTGTPQTTFVVLGVLIIAYSLVTDYEAGLVRFLRIRFHLLLDAIFGLAMLFLPSLLDLPAPERPPVYVIGALALCLAATTKTRAQGTHAHASL
jgi:hypothetical protein